MIITQQQQEELVESYIKNHTLQEGKGFVDGIAATLKLIQTLTLKDKHFFTPDEDNTRFCACGKYLTDQCHIRAN
jgi:hypothetical protein